MIAIKQVGVLGSGVMGAQIAAHFANAGIKVILFDLKASGKTNGDENTDLSILALTKLQQLNPKPLASATVLKLITPANYTDHLYLLKECDLIIEAIAERLDLKQDLYTKIASCLKPGVIMASNTSGLGIATLANSLPQAIRNNFCGIHFFNPPRYMPLVELIPHAGTDKEILDQVETFLVSTMGKHVVVAKDTPNFIGNRLGIFSLLITMLHAEKFNLPFEVVDGLTGKELGRAKSATFRTADVIGLDTFMHVVETFTTACADDGFAHCYVTPQWMLDLINKGSLGAKVKAGVFKKDTDGIKVIDLSDGNYRFADRQADAETAAILRAKDWKTKFAYFRSNKSNEAQFLWACFRDCFHYASVLLGEIADSPREMDFALRCGFAWKEGLFEIWQQAGWLEIAQAIHEDIKAGKSISTRPLPDWVFKLNNGIYHDNQYFALNEERFITRKLLPVYQRQIFPELLLNESNNTTCNVLLEDDNVKLWHSGDKIGILSFKSKMCAISQAVLKSIAQAITVAEAQCTALVFWQETEIFSVGANLDEMSKAIAADGAQAIDMIIGTGQEVIARQLMYCKIPTIAAVRGYALGGGCEVMLHCSATVAALESSIGLVEANVGLLPGWGGTTEMAYRASLNSDSWADLVKRYSNLIVGKMASSALEARDMGLLNATDQIILGSREVLFVAKEHAKGLIDNYQAKANIGFKVFGREGYEKLEQVLSEIANRNKFSQHDVLIAKNIAKVMCGGDVASNTMLQYQDVLAIEKEHFQQLALTTLSYERIAYMLANGKALKN